jgi:hypothetical protein
MPFALTLLFELLATEAAANAPSADIAIAAKATTDAHNIVEIFMSSSCLKDG